jgi:hypothetical protein
LLPPELQFSIFLCSHGALLLQTSPYRSAVKTITGQRRASLPIEEPPCLNIQKRNFGMASETSTAERRKHKRFQIKSKTFAAFFGPDTNRKIGEIINLSTGGMAFRYLNYEKESYGSISSDKSVELDIFWDGDGYSLGTVPVKTISDFVISRISTVSFIAMRHCRMKFTELTLFQELKLEHFIKNHLSR